MDNVIHLGGRAAAGYYAFKHFGSRVPGGPWVAALLGVVAAGIVLNLTLPRR
jgi:hypothetical protein